MLMRFTRVVWCPAPLLMLWTPFMLFMHPLPGSTASLNVLNILPVLCPTILRYQQHLPTGLHCSPSVGQVRFKSFLKSGCVLLVRKLKHRQVDAFSLPADSTRSSVIHILPSQVTDSRWFNSILLRFQDYSFTFWFLELFMVISVPILGAGFLQHHDLWMRCKDSEGVSQLLYKWFRD